MKYIDIHTHKKRRNENVFSLQNINPEEFVQPSNSTKNNCFSVGIHPWHIDTIVEEKINLLKQIASNPFVLAIGETGLDKVCNIDFDLQKKVFHAQIAIAKEVKKPLMIHCVKAYNEVQQILKENETNIPVIFHGFRGKPQLAKELTNNGFYLSFGTLFNEESLKATPLDRIFLETDDSEGEITNIYTRVANIKSVTIEELIEKISENANRCSIKCNTQPHLPALPEVHT